MEHIADRVAAALLAGGWVEDRAPGPEGAVRCFRKLVPGAAEAGALVPDGRRVLFVQICERGRWFERVDGWGKVEKDVDLREFEEAAAAIAAVLGD